MSFNGNEGEVISLSTAAGWTANYRDQMGHGDPKGHFFGKSKIQDILDQSGCVGIRMYHGIDDDDQKVIILVGVDADENDMTSGTIVERSIFCPPRCGSSNSLNS